MEKEYDLLKIKKDSMVADLHAIIVNSNSVLEGNSFYEHRTLKLHDDLYTKQVNLFTAGKKADKKICEIGFNAGHSSMLMLLARDQSPFNLTVFDIGEHAYTRPCLEYIKLRFPHIDIEYIEGDSTVMVPNWLSKHPEAAGTYDVVHVDGGHIEHCIFHDMTNADILVKLNGIIIIDDTYLKTINSYVEKYLSTGKYTEVDILPTKFYQHRIIQKTSL
jgi:predicted O-methyltransferase YrrM